MSTCLEMYRSIPRYLAARAAGPRVPGLLAGPVAPVRLVDRAHPRLPGADWVRVLPRLAGICGSDLSALSGSTSFYFSALVSMPFTPGHEVVGELADDHKDLKAGQRVVLDPVLSCLPRGIDPFCLPCASGRPSACERVTGGHVGPGLQTGYCAGTSGGWGQMLVAHRSQLHLVPQDMDDETAVMVEPLACAIRAVRRAEIKKDAHVLIVGAGTVGLLTLIAVRKLTGARRVGICAKHPHQEQLARQFGADDVYSPDEAIGAVRRSTRAFRLNPERTGPFLLGGVDVAFECVGSGASLDMAMRVTKAGGRVVLCGMPQGADLSPAWFRELELVGAYSGSGAFPDAIALAGEAKLGELVGASYPLSRWREALDHALGAGVLGATKIVFDPRLEN